MQAPEKDKTDKSVGPVLKVGKNDDVRAAYDKAVNEATVRNQASADENLVKEKEDKASKEAALKPEYDQKIQ